MSSWTGISAEQYGQLLKPLSGSRIAKRKQAGLELSYLEAWDVRAHLIRIFGFGGWSSVVESADLAFEENVNGKWSVGYKVLLRLTIHDLGCYYTEAAIGSSTQGSRGEAHDMAIKTAESDALKRAAINLGTQFGLSLYDNGSRQDVVGHTLNAPIDYEPSPPVALVPSTQVVAPEAVERYAKAIMTATDELILKDIYDALVASGTVEESLEGVSLRQMIVTRLEELRS